MVSVEPALSFGSVGCGVVLLGGVDEVDLGGARGPDGSWGPGGSRPRLEGAVARVGVKSSSPSSSSNLPKTSVQARI